MMNTAIGANFMRKSVWITVILSVFAFCGSAFALTAGDNYTVSFSVVQSNGTVGAASYSTTATADSTGLITFSLSGVPDNTSCNFMVVKATNTSVNPNTVDLESVVPCPNAGTTMPLGLSSVTNAQATALEAAFKAAGTDDPILALFGLTMVRTTGISAADLAKVAQYAELGITGTGGFVDFLETNHSNIVNATTLGEYRKNIVKDLADPNAGYSKLIKDSVDATSSSTAQQAMGKAASVILGNLVQATHAPTDTGIHAGWIMEAIDAMGSIVLPDLMDPANGLAPETVQEVQSNIGTGLDKLRVQVEIQKYENAMSLLGGTSADVQQFQTAATALANAVDAAMEKFNQTAFINGVPASTAIMNAAQADMDNATQTAFNDFQTNGIAVSDARIGIATNGNYDGITDPYNMIKNICTALGNGTIQNMPDPTNQGASTICTTVLANMDHQWGLFKYYGPSGTQTNWPINMVILSDWASKIKEAGGGMSYTRDTATIPDSQQYDAGQWMGFCNGVTQTKSTCVSPPGNWDSGSNTCNYFNKNDCSADSGGGIWIPERSCFGQSPLTGEQQNCRQNPSPYWVMFAIQEDIWIEQSIMQDAMPQQGGGMTPLQIKTQQDAQMTAQQAFDNALDGIIAGNISGTTDGTTKISKDQKKAIMELMSPPQM